MPEHQTNGKQGPFVGSKCIAGPGGAWAQATIQRVNEDSSFKIELDSEELLVLCRNILQSLGSCCLLMGYTAIDRA